MSFLTSMPWSSIIIQYVLDHQREENRMRMAWILKGTSPLQCQIFSMKTSMEVNMGLMLRVTSWLCFSDSKNHIQMVCTVDWCWPPVHACHPWKVGRQPCCILLSTSTVISTSCPLPLPPLGWCWRKRWISKSGSHEEPKAPPFLS